MKAADSSNNLTPTYQITECYLTEDCNHLSLIVSLTVHCIQSNCAIRGVMAKNISQGME